MMAMTSSIAENALRRYGRAQYDITPRLTELGNDLFIRTRSSLDCDEVEDVNDRLSRITYSQSLKSYPRKGPSSPRITVVIANTYAPHVEVSQKQVEEITSRLLKPTLVSRLRQSEPVERPSRNVSPIRSRSTTPRMHPPGYVPAGILRLNSPASSTSSSRLNDSKILNDSLNSSRCSERSSSPGKVRFAIKSPKKALKDSPLASQWQAFKGEKSSEKDRPEPTRPKSVPIRLPKPLPKVVAQKQKSKPPKSPKKPPVQKIKKPLETERKSPQSPRSPRSPPSDVKRARSVPSNRPKRLGFIATILETDDEYN